MAKRPCRICGCWFVPDRRVGARQRTCLGADCREKWRSKTRSRWRAQHPEYFRKRRIEQRSGRCQPPEPFRVSPPLAVLPWEIAQEEFAVRGADFLAQLGEVLLSVAQSEYTSEVSDFVGDPRRLLPLAAQSEIRVQVIDSA